MPFKDLREFIDRLEKEGDIQRIEEEVDWNLEAGAIVRHSNERGLPAPFFQKIKGYPESCKIFGSPLATLRRLAIAMGMNPNASTRELQAEYLKAKKHPIKPVLVKDGPCKENIHTGDEVDLLEFPVPMVHEGDGGRFIGTWHLDVSKDPDSGWVNWGMYRHMIHNKNTIGIVADPYTHLGGVYTQKYEAINKPMEVAIAVGPEPILTFCATSPLPYGVSEVDIAGAIRGEPVELIGCETVDLAVPATSEIVIEGEMRPCERIDEGPFGEYTGYMAALRYPRPAIRVKAVTHRNNPILTMTSMGIPVTDDHVIMSVSLAAELYELLRGRGLPVTGVSAFPETCYLLVVVAVKVPFANVAWDIATVIWASRCGNTIPYIIVVEDDTDPFNMSDVLFALATKCHPHRGIHTLEQTSAIGFEPWADRHEREYLIGPKTYFDCTWPVDWEPSDIPKKASLNQIYPAEVRQKALETWRKYGY
ncbi:MAG: UbiD family decarboxylase [Chloroflexi bacterium]|nr:UbiD family decarboxylase [Chloroflexota bacterium]